MWRGIASSRSCSNTTAPRGHNGHQKFGPLAASLAFGEAEVQMRASTRVFLNLVAAVSTVYFAIMTFLSIPLVSDVLVDHLQIYPALPPEAIEAAAADPRTAIVILSAGRRLYAPEFGGDTVDELALER